MSTAEHAATCIPFEDAGHTASIMNNGAVQAGARLIQGDVTGAANTIKQTAVEEAKRAVRGLQNAWAFITGDEKTAKQLFEEERAYIEKNQPGWTLDEKTGLRKLTREDCEKRNGKAQTEPKRPTIPGLYLGENGQLITISKQTNLQVVSSPDTRLTADELEERTILLHGPLTGHPTICHELVASVKLALLELKERG